MNKFLSAFFLLAGLSIALPPALAETDSSAPHKAVKKKVKKKTAAKKAETKVDERATEMEGDNVDTAGLISTNYSCELGDKVTVFQNPKNDKQITLRWRDRLHNLFRVSTTTGADRFEGPKSGLVWIGIPAKSILLDSNKGRQLANECKDAQQLKHST